MNQHQGTILVDLDGTLANYDGWKGIEHIGAPVPLMVERVMKWITDERDVRIFTARVFPETCLEDVTFCADFTPATWNGTGDMGDRLLAGLHVREWCKVHLGRVLPITCRKDMKVVEIWDDRAVSVVPNRGITVETIPAYALKRVCAAVGYSVGTGDEYVKSAEIVEAFVQKLALNANLRRTACEDVDVFIDSALDALRYAKPDDVVRACQLLQRAKKRIEEVVQ